MISNIRQERLLPSTSAFAISHCMICAAGWTRTGEDGKKVILCLLDREPVWQDMTDCDRFEPKEEPAPRRQPPGPVKTDTAKN